MAMIEFYYSVGIKGEDLFFAIILEPLVGNIDLSPLLLLVICQIILLVPLAMLESLAVRLL